MKLSLTTKIRNIMILNVQVLTILTLSACMGSKVQPLDEVKSVHVTPAVMDSIEINVDYSSKLKPVEEITVSSKISGKVESVRVEVGQTVKAGEVMYTLDKKDLEVQHSQSQAALNSANANYKRTSDSGLSQQITQAESQVNQAQVQYDSAKDIYEKTQNLFRNGAVSKQQMDDVENRFKSAKIQMEAAEESLRLLKEKSGPQSVEVASAEVDRAQAAVQQSSLQLDNTIITSPIEGVVAAKNVDVGEIIFSGTPAFTVMDTKTMIAEINVTDKLVKRLKKGQVVPLRINTLEGKLLDGKIDIISPGADVKTQLYNVKIKIDNAGGLLMPGVFTRVFLPVHKKENVVIVPNEAIVNENSIQYVYTVVDGVVKKKQVVTGLANEKVTEIVKGLEPGENVLTEGQNFLSEGEKVVIKQ